MGIEYIADIKEEHFQTFKVLLNPTLSRNYPTWVRFRTKEKLRAFEERAATVIEIEVSPIEFGNYCRSLERPDFSIRSLDECARAKSLAAGSVKWKLSQSQPTT
jgi:hypothetical protein